MIPVVVIALFVAPFVLGPLHFFLSVPKPIEPAKLKLPKAPLPGTHTTGEYR